MIIKDIPEGFEVAEIRCGTDNDIVPGCHGLVFRRRGIGSYPGPILKAKNGYKIVENEDCIIEAVKILDTVDVQSTVSKETEKTGSGKQTVPLTIPGLPARVQIVQWGKGETEEFVIGHSGGIYKLSSPSVFSYIIVKPIDGYEFVKVGEAFGYAGIYDVRPIAKTITIKGRGKGMKRLVAIAQTCGFEVNEEKTSQKTA